jgi:hypothetical protein
MAETEARRAETRDSKVEQMAHTKARPDRGEFEFGSGLAPEDRPFNQSCAT